jgi:prophage maintenance system killer protein
VPHGRTGTWQSSKGVSGRIPNEAILINALQNTACYRTSPGTQIVNDQSGQTVHFFLQDPAQIIALMSNLEDVTNNDASWYVDPLIKMAVIHHQIESIHPFYDGNGRTGRIVNVLYLSRYIVRNKSAYHSQLQAVRETRRGSRFGHLSTPRSTPRRLSTTETCTLRVSRPGPTVPAETSLPGSA